MRKEHQIIGLVFATTALAAQACYRADLPILPPTVTPTITPTPFQPLPPTPRPEVGATLSPTPTEPLALPTPTPAPEIFSKNGVEFDRATQVVIYIKTRGGSDFITSYIPLFYPSDLPLEQKDKITTWDFMAGNQRGLTATDGKNIILELHSGRSIAKGTKDEAEDLRNFLEGRSDATILNPDYIAEQMQKLLGAEVTFFQETKQAKFAISAVSQIPHNKMPEYEGNITGVLDLVTGFEVFKEKPGILLTFCGWGPENSSNTYGDPDYRYTYTEYVIGLSPLD